MTRAAQRAAAKDIDRGAVDKTAKRIAVDEARWANHVPDSIADCGQQRRRRSGRRGPRDDLSGREAEDGGGGVDEAKLWQEAMTCDS